jgi:damage-control phosphatase, subfamily I
MKTFPDCLPCFLRQSIQAAKLAGAGDAAQKAAADEAEKYLQTINLSDSPPKISRNMHIIIRKLLSNADPYREIKDRYNGIAFSMYPLLKERVNNSKDRLLTAVRIAIAGNVIDFGAQLEFELDKDVHDVLYKDFAVFDYASFRDKLEKEKQVLYLGDNTGETVFDRILIEEMKELYGSKVKYAVKESPIINDATREDAVFAGIDKSAGIISTGCNSPGIVLEYCSKDFTDTYNSSRFIISKGQGNFETLNSGKRPIFFLFKVKCDVVGQFMGLPNGSIVLKEGKGGS